MVVIFLAGCVYLSGCGDDKAESDYQLYYVNYDKGVIESEDFIPDSERKEDMIEEISRKIGSGERLITSITNTVLERDVNWYGKPSEEKMKLLENLNPELFISLIKGTDFPIEYMATCSRARFKIGRCQIPGRIFDMVVADAPGRETSQLEVFKGVKKYLRNIGA